MPLWKSGGPINTCGHKKNTIVVAQYTAFFAVEWFLHTLKTHIKNGIPPEISHNRTDLTHCRVLYLEDDSGNYILYLLQHEQVFCAQVKSYCKN